MAILACYADMHPRTKVALEAYAPGAEFVYVGDDPISYWREIGTRWTGEEDLVIIEQDIVITETNIPSLLECDQLWCSYWFYGPPLLQAILIKLANSLGCTKFSAELQRAMPWEKMFQIPVIWSTLDVCLNDRLVPAGYKPHVHGQVKHLHEYEMRWVNQESPGMVR